MLRRKGVKVMQAFTVCALIIVDSVRIVGCLKCGSGIRIFGMEGYHCLRILEGWESVRKEGPPEAHGMVFRGGGNEVPGW